MIQVQKKLILLFGKKCSTNRIYIFIFFIFLFVSQKKLYEFDIFLKFLSPPIQKYI